MNIFRTWAFIRWHQRILWNFNAILFIFWNFSIRSRSILFVKVYTLLSFCFHLWKGMRTCDFSTFFCFFDQWKRAHTEIVLLNITFLKMIQNIFIIRITFFILFNWVHFNKLVFILNFCLAFILFSNVFRRIWLRNLFIVQLLDL